MNQIIEIQFTPWDQTYKFLANDVELQVGDLVVAKTELGTDVGKISEIKIRTVLAFT